MCKHAHVMHSNPSTPQAKPATNVVESWHLEAKANANVKNKLLPLHFLKFNEK